MNFLLEARFFAPALGGGLRMTEKYSGRFSSLASELCEPDEALA